MLCSGQQQDLNADKASRGRAEQQPGLIKIKASVQNPNPILMCDSLSRAGTKEDSNYPTRIHRATRQDTQGGGDNKGQVNHTESKRKNRRAQFQNKAGKRIFHHQHQRARNKKD